MFKKNNSTKAFTLLEILLVVGIIALLAGIVIVAINPGRQLAQTRNAERKSDLKQLHSAMTQYYIDHGFYPASTTLSTTLKEICDTGSTSSPSGLLCTGLIDLSELVPTYITAIPKDPQGPLALLQKIIPTVYAAVGGTAYYVAEDVTKKLIYLINSEGKTIEGFPLRGASMFSIGKFSDKSDFHLIVGGDDSFLYNYKLKVLYNHFFQE